MQISIPVNRARPCHYRARPCACTMFIFQRIYARPCQYYARPCVTGKKMQISIPVNRARPCHYRARSCVTDEKSKMMNNQEQQQLEWLPNQLVQNAFQK